MDTNGARALAERLGELSGEPDDPSPPQRLASSDAAPIFHWFGVEPPLSSSDDDSA